jgi:hypothetical protein
MSHTFGARAISEDRVAPWLAKEIRLMCPHCNNSVFVQIPWDATAEVRTRFISEGINEHRAICTAATAEQGRVYTIDYPRA